MIKSIWPLVFTLGLQGCASLQDIGNVLFGNSSQKITRTPIWVYKPDLLLGVDGETFSGMGVSALKEQTDLQVWSPVDADRIEISSCSRHDVCQLKGGQLACDVKTKAYLSGRFEIETGWFGDPGKYFVYHYRPDRKERDDSCSQLMIEVYDKNTLASWGYLALRDNPDNNFPAKFTCNANDWTFKGVSVCAAKAGTIQEINFDLPVTDYKANDKCGIKKISDKEFEFKPQSGWCRASFEQNKKFHDVIMDGYEEVLIRDGK